MVWLFLSYYLGMHDEGIVMLQLMTMIAVLISVIGFLMALRALTRKFPETEYLEGIRSGAIIAGISALFAALAQFIYFQWINPERTQQMVELIRAYYLESGLSENEANQFAEGAETTYGMVSYMIQGALGALLIGMISTAIMMLFLRRRAA